LKKIIITINSQGNIGQDNISLSIISNTYLKI